MKKPIRFIQEKDIQQIADIYSYYVNNTVISFETIAPSTEEMKNRVLETTKFYPWIVYDEGSEITGYAYASPHRQRAAYKWSVDVTVYLKHGAGGRGIGTRLYKELLSILQQQGFYNAYAGIALPNEASVALHQKLGFNKIGEYNRVGFKNDAWWNVGWWEFGIQDHISSPAPPISINYLLNMKS